jgi:sortase (surface protein transpeptidase)
VLDPSGDQRITLVTCYPFYFVGHAPQRYIVRAQLDESLSIH